MDEENENEQGLIVKHSMIRKYFWKSQKIIFVNFREKKEKKFLSAE